MLPKYYRPIPPLEDNSMVKPYHFYHKPDQIMLIPVKRSAYTSDFYKGYYRIIIKYVNSFKYIFVSLEIRTFSQVNFYVNPRKVLKETEDHNSVKSEVIEEIETESTDPILPGSMSLLQIQIKQGCCSTLGSKILITKKPI